MFGNSRLQSTKTGLSRTPAGNDLDFFFCLGGRVLFLLRSFRSNTKRKRHPPVFGQQKRVRGIDRIVFPCLKKRKAPTVTGCGVSRGIVLSVGSGSPLLFGDMLCKTKAKRKWEDHKHGSRSARKTRKHCRWVQRRNRGVIGMPFPTRF